MKKALLAILSLCLLPQAGYGQDFNQIDDSGQITQRGGSNKNFNKHNNDTTKNKEIPKGIYVWTVDRKFPFLPARSASAVCTDMYKSENLTNFVLHFFHLLVILELDTKIDWRHYHENC
mgnify:CR=1 FL=1